MFQTNLFEGKHVIVTGGGTGLGRAMATKLAALGARLTLAARHKDRLEAAAKELEEKTKSRVLCVETDIRSPEACDHLVQSSVREQGELYAIINNAAANFLCTAEDLSANGFNVIVDVVLKGTFFVTQAAGRQMIAQKRGGSILSILTPYAFTGSAFVLPSAMAKAGVLAMTRSLAVEWGSAYGIRLNAIAPGPFPTEGAWSRLVPDEAMASEIKKDIPLHRFGEHEELANLAAFLLSPGCEYLTGECITIDGGRWLKGAGEFNRMVEMDRENVKQLFAAMRPPKKSEG